MSKTGINNYLRRVTSYRNNLPQVLFQELEKAKMLSPRARKRNIKQIIIFAIKKKVPIIATQGAHFIKDQISQLFLEMIYQSEQWMSENFLRRQAFVLLFFEPVRTKRLEILVKEAIKRGWIAEAQKTAELIPRELSRVELKAIIVSCIHYGWMARVEEIMTLLQPVLTREEIEICFTNVPIAVTEKMNGKQKLYLPYPPEGWLTQGEIWEKFSIRFDRSFLNPEFEGYVALGDIDEICRFRSKKGQFSSLFYSPKVVAHLGELYQGRQMSPVYTDGVIYYA